MEITLVLSLLLLAVLLFATEKFPVDFVALMVLGALLILRLVTPQEGISGFSNPATITVGAMFVLSSALRKTGALDLVGRMLAQIGKTPSTLLLVVMLTVGAVSAFINNTAAVAVFLPIVLTLSRRNKVSPSKLLIPLSYASQFGGVCTLIGTSTNLLVSSISEKHGSGTFSMFEFAPLGLIMFVAGTLYLIVFSRWILPDLGIDQSTEICDQEIPETEVKNSSKSPIVLMIIATVVGRAAFGVMPILVTAILGCVALVATRCITLDEAYAAIDWKVIFLLACILPLGIAMEKSGAAQLIANHALGVVGSYGPLAVLAALYLITAILTETMSNNAAAVLLAPIAFSTATRLGVDPKPFLIAVCFAASTSFATPVGYQTNTMVYNAGRYRFTDFMRVGIPLNLIFWGLSVYFIPKFWHW